MTAIICKADKISLMFTIYVDVKNAFPSDARLLSYNNSGEDYRDLFTALDCARGIYQFVIIKLIIVLLSNSLSHSK
jgi:hypothetical protein